MKMMFDTCLFNFVDIQCCMLVLILNCFNTLFLSESRIRFKTGRRTRMLNLSFEITQILANVNKMIKK